MKAYKFAALTMFGTYFWGASIASATTVPLADITEVQNALQNNKYQINGVGSEFSFGGVVVLDVAGYGELFAYCTQYFIGGSNVDRDVTVGLTAYSPDKAAKIAALYSNALPIFMTAANNYRALNGGSLAYNPVYGAEFDGGATYNYSRIGAALGNALWEIVDETAIGAQPDITTGNFKVFVGRFDIDRDNLTLDWLSHIRDGSWTDIGGVDYFYASGGGTQDFLWVRPTATGGVPEPMSWAMLVAGFGLTGAVMRRKARYAVA